MSVYEPDVSAGKGYRFTGALFDMNYLNEGILLGWMLSPTVTGDNYVHLYAEWGIRGKDCANSECPGFVQVRSDFAFGAILRPDPKTGNWWLNYGKEGTPVGYWPKSIFTHMTDKANEVSWGGYVHSTSDESSPPMGSGHFASEGFGKSAFFEDINIVNDKNQFVVPNSAFCFIENFNTKCYTMSKIGMNKAGLGFFFGGPGGCRG
ncbi:hypothetical protein LUZ60_002042 [Juncus effusus]|nr:hypothetical protein LUZ60_002042 [Juncus effusus]